MNRIHLYLGLVSIITCTSMSVLADKNNGKELHDSNCTSCHISMQGGDGSGIYLRKNKRIESHPALVKQVNRCRDSLGVPWPDDHVADVVEYLDTSFYKFSK